MVRSGLAAASLRSRLVLLSAHIDHRYVLVRVLLLLARQRVLGDRLEGLLDVDGLLGGRLEVRHVVLLLTPLHRLLGRDGARVGQVDLVADHHEREVLGVAWRRLDEELVAPALQVLERRRRGHVVY